MTFMHTRIDHELSDEEKKWIEEEIAEQEERFAKIAQQMDDLAPTREKWYQEFFDRITTIGFRQDQLLDTCTTGSNHFLSYTAYG